MHRVQSRTLLAAQKLDYLERIADVMIELSDSLYPRTDQLTSGLCFSHHLVKKSARKQPSQTIADDEHLRSGKASLD